MMASYQLSDVCIFIVGIDDPLNKDIQVQTIERLEERQFPRVLKMSTKNAKELHGARRSDYFVVAEFAGDAFTHLCELRCKIYGSFLTQHCLEHGLCLPKRKHPVFSLTMSNAVVCFAGLTRVGHPGTVDEWESQLGFDFGCHTRGDQRLPELEENELAEKFKIGEEYGIPIMHTNWIEQLWDDAVSNIHIGPYELNEAIEARVRYINGKLNRSSSASEILLEVRESPVLLPSADWVATIGKTRNKERKAGVPHSMYHTRRMKKSLGRGDATMPIPIVLDASPPHTSERKRRRLSASSPGGGSPQEQQGSAQTVAAARDSGENRPSMLTNVDVIIVPHAKRQSPAIVEIRDRDETIRVIRTSGGGRSGKRKGAVPISSSGR